MQDLSQDDGRSEEGPVKVEPRFTHKGYVNAAGKRLPSVTTICKLIDKPEPLLFWAWRMGCEGKDFREVRDDAATAGHAAHAMIEARIKGRELPFDLSSLDPEIRANAERGFAGFEKWIEGNRFQLIHSEVAMVSERHQFGGRLDCIASVLGELCICDWKCAGGIYTSGLVQVAAYRGAWNETHMNEPILGCHMLRIKKDDAGFLHQYFPPPTLDKAWRAFLVCRELYDLQNELGKLL